MRRPHRACLGSELRLHAVDLGSPGVPVPRGRQNVERLGVGTGVRDRDRHQQIVWIGLRVVRLDDPVAVLVEGAGVEELVLGVELASARVLSEEIAVWELPLRIVVAPAVP